MFFKGFGGGPGGGPGGKKNNNSLFYDCLSLYFLKVVVVSEVVALVKF